MDYDTAFSDFTEMAPDDFKRYEIKQGMSPSPMPAEMLVDTPRAPLYPSAYPSRFLHRGRFPRRRKSRHSQFNRCSPYVGRQYRPHSYNGYYDMYQDCYTDPRMYSNQNKNKIGFEYSWEPSFCKEELPIIPKSLGTIDQEQISLDSSCFTDSTEKNKGLTAFENQRKISEMGWNCYDSTSKSKGCLVSKKRKRQSNSDQNVNEDLTNYDGINFMKNSSNDCTTTKTVYMNNVEANEATNFFECENSAKSNENKTPTTAPQILRSVCPDSSLSSVKTNTPSQETMNNSTGTICGDKPVYLNLSSDETSDACSILNSLLKEMEQTDTLEIVNNPECKLLDVSQIENYQLMTITGSDSTDFETNLNVSNSPLLSLIQQNQILTDLLSKVMNTSSIFKVNKDTQTLETNYESTRYLSGSAPSFENHSKLTSYMKFPPSKCTLENRTQTINENVLLSNTKKSILSNEDSILTKQNKNSNGHTENSDILYKDESNYQLHIQETANSKNDFSLLDFLSAESFSGADTNLNSLTNFILEEPTLECLRLPNVVIEKTTENILEEARFKSYAQNEKEVKTVVKEATVRIEALSKMNNSITEIKPATTNQFNNESTPADKLVDKSLSCSLQVPSKRQCSVQTQTGENNKAKRNAVKTNSEEEVASNTRKLRHTVQKKQNSCVFKQLEEIKRSKLTASKNVPQNDTIENNFESTECSAKSLSKEPIRKRGSSSSTKSKRAKRI